MRDDVRDAIESACSTGLDESRRLHRFATVRATVLAVVRELPDDMNLRELRDELEIAVSQTPGERAGRAP